jgi:surface carbohydrate biosynthesis protein (TIGR04326 family)
MFTMSGYPPERLRQVEALRFQYLAQFARFRHAATDRTVPADVLKVLVLGDFTRRQTLAMLSCLVAADKLVPRKLSFTLKAHPVSRIEASDVPELSVQFTDRPLGEILGDFDLAFSSNSSSAGLDALLSGVPLAVFLDDNSLNHSPLRGVPGIRFVNSPEELAKVLESNAEREQVALDRFFWLDEDLPRWRALVSPLESGKT